MLQQVLPADVFSVLLVFVRLGAALMVVPGFAEIYVARRVRLTLAAALTLVLVPLVSPGLPPLPSTPVEMLFIIGGELIVGLFLGIAARLTLSALHVAGTVIAFQSSLAYAMVVDPTQGSQGALVASLLTLLGVVLIFVSDLHYLVLGALVDSYVLFTPGALPPAGSFAELAVDFVARSFAIGVQIAAPFIVYGIIFYVGLGLIARLMPQMQVFFIVMPLQIMAAFFVLSVTLTGGLLWFLDHFEDTMTAFTVLR